MAERRHLDRETAELRRRRGRERLARLEELDGYKVAKHDEDIRGWDVFTPDGSKVGKVEELIVDTTNLKARYMEVKVHKDVAGEDDDRWALVPVGLARLNDDDEEVVIDRLPAQTLLTKDERKRKPLDHEVEMSVRREYGADIDSGGDADFYAHDIYDERRLRRERERDRGDSYIIRPEDSAEPDTRI